MLRQYVDRSVWADLTRQIPARVQEGLPRAHDLNGRRDQDHAHLHDPVVTTREQSRGLQVDDGVTGHVALPLRCVVSHQSFRTAWPVTGTGRVLPVVTCMVSYYGFSVEIHRSARKHRIADVDIKQAASDFVVAYSIDDDAPARELRFGFDTKGRLLETVVLLLDDGTELVIHAMKARPQYFDLLPEGGWT